MIITSFIDFIFITKLFNGNGKSFYLEQVIIFLYGFFLFLLGSNPLKLSSNLILIGFPYILFFLAGNLTWKIPLKIFSSSMPSKKDFAPFLAITIAFTFIAALVGYLNDDPMISTIAAVYLPFPLVAIVFPPAITPRTESELAYGLPRLTVKLAKSVEFPNVAIVEYSIPVL